jgi:predicted ABC-type ATPase
MSDKNLYIIAGCNGAGKTTASYTILPDILSCREFVNADEIAKGLSPFQPEKAAFEAGRIMLGRISQLLQQDENFAFETTLATRSYTGKIREAQALGYTVTLVFFWLKSVGLAKDRVKARVSEGGHNIPEDVIERRYRRGIINLFGIYAPVADKVLIFDNTNGNPELLAKAKSGSTFTVVDEERFNALNQIR